MIWLPAIVDGVAELTARASSITLRVPGWPGHLAGSHVDVRATAEDGYQAARSYSLAAPTDGELIRIAVEELEDGELSPYLTRVLAAGDRLEVRGPLGRWFVWDESEAGPVQLIGGGSGVVPLVAIARAHAEAGSSARMELLYAVRDPGSVFFAEELGRLSGRDRPGGPSSSDLRVIYAFSREAPAGSGLVAGRLDAAGVVAATLPPELDPTVYVCGATPFVEAVATALLDAGHDPARVRTERYGGV